MENGNNLFSLCNKHKDIETKAEKIRQLLKINLTRRKYRNKLLTALHHLKVKKSELTYDEKEYSD